MKLVFYGGAKEVGRSCILLQSESSNLLLDAGVKLGKELELPSIPDDILQKLDGIIITHTHLDHVGLLPIKFSNSKVKIFATKPTRDLLHVLLSDFHRLQNKEKKLFSSRDIDNVMKKIQVLEYNTDTQFKDISFRFLEAGHILGSAMVLIQPEKRVYVEDNVNRGKLLYTGDFNISSSKILNSCERNLSVENLVIEATYSGKEDVFPSQKELINRFSESIKSTLTKNGIVIIPAFAVGRAQEILILLHDLIKAKRIPECNIYIDGMLKKALRIYRQNVIYAKRELQLRILLNEEDPFKSKYFKVSRKKDKSDIQKPCIIVTTSGMITGGPIINYLKMFGGDENNKLIFIGYQAEGTNGRKILDGQKVIEFENEQIEVKLHVEQHRFSGHSDRNGLLSFIKSIKGLKKIFLVHSEQEKAEEFAKALSKKYEVVVPELFLEYKL
ncbi:MAG: MBL fold metallo-hydrolase [Candidatus Micrarchaeota archaeon]|nr:MBL fold metallo-hydrolase [Candidatus Micrarchaeota archaeon]